MMSWTLIKTTNNLPQNIQFSDESKYTHYNKITFDLFSTKLFLLATLD